MENGGIENADNELNCFIDFLRTKRIHDRLNRNVYIYLFKATVRINVTSTAVYQGKPVYDLYFGHCGRLLFSSLREESCLTRYGHIV